MKVLLLFLSLNSLAFADISIRTESRAHPPYSGSNYFIYEKANKVICTKVETCNKFDQCSIEYHAGTFIKEGDGEEAFDKKAAVIINPTSLKKHKCLSQLKLI